MEIGSLLLVISLLMDFLVLPPEKMVIATIFIVPITLFWFITNKKNSFH
ncbi:hypothetical protein IGJ83_003481 [Enterococcus pernyi]